MKISGGFKREKSAHQMNKKFSVPNITDKAKPEQNVIDFRVRS